MNTRHAPISPELFTELQGKSLEAFSVLADMNQRVLQGLVGLSATTAKEGLRACAELQSAAVEAARPGIASVTAPEALGSLGPHPFAWYQRGLLAAVEGTQQAFRLVEANAQVVTRSAERIQASAEQTGHEIQEALAASVDRLKALDPRA